MGTIGVKEVATEKVMMGGLQVLVNVIYLC